MKKKKNFVYIILFIFIITIITIFLTKGINLESTNNKALEEISGELAVHFIDVGQGDSTFIDFNGGSVLIDGGTKSGGEDVVNYLNDIRVDKIDYVIGTHPHEDHIGGLSNIINNFEIGSVIMPDKIHNTQTFENLIDTIISKDLEIVEAKSGDNYRVGDGDFTIVAPNSKDYSNLNNYSVSIMVNYGTTSFLLTGDAERESELEMIERYGHKLNSDVLKLGHHGSNTSSTDEFINVVKPSVGIISAGKDNIYGHPSPETLEIMKKYNVELYSTYEDGNIVITSNGKELKILADDKILTKNNNPMDIILKYKNILLDKLIN